MSNFQHFISMLSDYQPEILSLMQKDACISHIALLPTDHYPLSSTTLYISRFSTVSPIMSNLKGIHLIIIEDQPFSINFSLSDLNLAILHGSCSENFIYSQCVTIMENQNVLLSGRDILFSAFLEGKSISDVTTLTSNLLHNPIIVLDLNFKILTYSSGYYMQEEQWLPFFERGYCSFEYITEFNRRCPTNSTCFFMNSFPGSPNQYISKLFSRKKHLGYLIVTETQSPLSKMNYQLFCSASDLISNIMYTQNELQKTLTEYSRDHIMLECLTGEFKTKEAFLERIRGTEFETSAFYHVIIIDVNDYIHFDPRKDTLKNHISSIFLNNWMLWFQGNVVTIIRTEQSNIPIIETLKKELPFFKEKKLRLGISDPFTDLYSLAQYYRQSLQTLKFSKKLYPRAIFSQYNDYKFHDILSYSKVPNDWASYYSEEFKNILKFDLSNGSCYTDTIYHYIQSGRSLQKTAQVLFIHKNTVTYRINRAKELFHLDFDDTDLRFRFLYSYTLKKMLDQFLLNDNDTFC